MMKKLVLIAFSMLIFNLNSQSIQECNLELINAIMEDLFSPPVASRIHLYSNIAAYEVQSLKDENYLSLSPQISHMPDVTPDDIQDVNLDMASQVAFINSGKYFIYTEDKLLMYYDKLLMQWKKKLSPSSFEKSKMYGETVANNIIAWAKKDNYDYTRTLKRYELSDSLGAWIPTPPNYDNALEPNWMLMRMLTSKKGEYIPARPNMTYSEDKNSQFYKNAMSVYNCFKTLTPQQKEIAEYWDDNPMTTVSKGHLNYIFKKPTPGGHWLKITTQVSRDIKLTQLQSSELYTMVSIAMYEAFIHCWQTKYATNAIRPNSYLERLGYTDFASILETPNFPEYTSGHSAVSRSITTILGKYVSENYSFTDSAQILLGMKARSFKSFFQASEEVSFSRYCGGIHYLPSLVYGAEQGNKIGLHVLDKIKTRKNFKPYLNY